MHSKHRALFRVWTLVLLVNRAALGQAAGSPRTAPPMVAASGAPTITIMAAATGALVRSMAASNASLDLGSVSYFKGASRPGESSSKTSTSLVITTRFGLRVDCPGRPAGSGQVSVTMSRPDPSSSHAIAVDGISLGIAGQTLVQSMPCGSSGEHRLDVEVPVSTPAGSIGSTVAFLATLRN
jgi:hypothetical protein